MTARGRAALLAAALLPLPALAAACSTAARELSDEELVSQERFVRELRAPEPGAPSRAPLDAAGADAAAADAERLLAGGRPAEALEAVRAALLRAPPREQAARLRAIRLRAKKEVLRTAIARAEVAAPARAPEGGALPVRVSIRNLAPVPLVVGEPPSGTSPTLLLLRVTRTAHDVFGNVRTDSWEESHPVPGGEAPPGGAIELALSVDTARFRGTVPQGFVVYAFGGSVLPSALRVGETDVHERIPLEEGETLAFPQRGWEEVAADPGAHLDRGLREGNPVRVLLAAACLPAEGRPAAGASLARRLRDGPALPPAVEGAAREGLRWLGGDREADLWKPEAWEARGPEAAPEEER